jgi:integrase
MEYINENGGRENMHKDIIQTAVIKIRTEIIRRLKAVIVPDSSEAKSVLKAYERYHKPLSVAHDQYQSVIHQYKAPEPPPIKTLTEYKLEHLEAGERGISNDADSMLSSALQFREMNEQFGDNSDWRSIKYSGEYFQAEEELEHFLSNTRVIRDAVNNKNLTKARQLFEDITGKVRVVNTEVSSKPLESFEYYMSMFLNAGTEGNLPDKRPAWTTKIAEDSQRKGAIFSYIFKDKSLDEVSSKKLDETFSELILSLPKFTIRPYNGMTLEQRIKCSEDGAVEAHDIISNKTAREYKKFLQSFYSFVYKKHIIDDNPLNKMRFKIPSGSNKRGAFDNQTVRKIINYCSTQSDVNKKWPILIMAYSGMRNGEIMQLRTSDIYRCEETGIYYMHITTEAGTVKTDAGIRRVPIHRELLNMGFLSYFNSRKEGRLFDKTSRYLTNFYSSTLRSVCEIPFVNELSELFNLYSLRHTVITKLQGGNVNLAITQQLVGHSKYYSETSGYTHNLSLEELEKNLNLVSYN